MVRVEIVKTGSLGLRTGIPIYCHCSELEALVLDGVIKSFSQYQDFNNLLDYRRRSIGDNSIYNITYSFLGDDGHILFNKYFVSETLMSFDDLLKTLIKIKNE